MTVTIESHAASGLLATSTKGEEPAGVWAGEYDLMFCVSGWDERCVAVTGSASLRARRTVLIFFDERDDRGLREKHDATLSAFAERVSLELDIVRGSATDVASIWTALHEKLRALFLELGRPLNVLISASTCPRYYTLALLGVGVGQGLIRKLSVAYSDGVYPERDEDEIEVAFTGGTASVVAIPGLEGTTEPEKKRFFLVSLGFEGWRSMRAIARAEPDRVRVLLPDPGSSAEYVQRALEDNRRLLEEFSICDSEIVRAPASDAVAVWRALVLEGPERLADENTHFLCTGTKPHSIGLALRAMQLGSPAVLYSVPEEYRVVHVRSGRVHWRFDIVSTTTPNS